MNTFWKWLRRGVVVLLVLCASLVVLVLYPVLSFDTEKLPERYGQVDVQAYPSTAPARPLIVGFGGVTILLQDPVFSREASISDTLNWLDRAITGLMTLGGFALDGMTRDTGWRFLSIGRRLERMTFTTLSLQVALSEGRSSGLTWLLRLSDSIVTYRSRYMARPEWLPVLDLLVMDEANPRAVMFTAKGVLDYLYKLEKTFGPCGSALLEPHVTALAQLNAATDLNPESEKLITTLAQLRSAGFALGDDLSKRFFNLAASSNRPMLAS